MRLFCEKLRQFVACDGGLAAVEYAMLLALIASVCLMVIASVGNHTGGSFNRVGNSLNHPSGPIRPN
jgi:Flp pilus assembly pilin Flp